MKIKYLIDSIMDLNEIALSVAEHEDQVQLVKG